MIAVFDTNIVIDALNGIAAADTEYARYKRVLISRTHGLKQWWARKTMSSV